MFMSPKFYYYDVALLTLLGHGVLLTIKYPLKNNFQVYLFKGIPVFICLSNPILL